MCGDASTRLWPASRKVRPKQFVLPTSPELKTTIKEPDLGSKCTALHQKRVTLQCSDFTVEIGCRAHNAE
jgi:mannose-1-phosphate guanylyltransferase